MTIVDITLSMIIFTLISLPTFIRRRTDAICDNRLKILSNRITTLSDRLKITEDFIDEITLVYGSDGVNKIYIQNTKLDTTVN